MGLANMVSLRCVAQQALGADVVIRRTVSCNDSGHAAQGQRYAQGNHGREQIP